MKNRTLFVTTAAMLALAAGTAAQTEPIRDQTNQPPPKENETWRTRPGERVVVDPSNPNARTHAHTMGLVACEKAIGTNVYGNDGEKLGDVNDLVISRGDGRITYALVGRGGVLGVGESVVPVPFHALGWDPQKKAFTLPITKERMKEAPVFEKGEWTSLHDSARSDPVQRFFGVERAMVDPNDQAFRTEMSSKLPDTERPLLRLTEIKGKKLMSDDGRELGRIEELVHDAATGRMAFAVVTFGGTLGLGEDRVAVPWTMLDVNREGRLLAVNLDKEVVRTAPRITSRDWSELRDPNFASRVYAHFGKQAPWLDRQITAVDRDPWMVDYDRMYNGGTDYQITGAIDEVRTSSPVQGAPEIMTVMVRSESGENIEVQLAPRSFLDGENVGFKQGDRVTVRGKLVERDGKRTLIATDLTPSGGRAVTLRNSDGSIIWRP